MQQHREMWSRADGFTVTTDKRHLDIDLIHRFLSEESYWATGIDRELVVATIEQSSLCYGVYQGNPATDEQARQAGFARVVTDFVRFAWLGDVFILPEYRGKALGKWLMSLIVEHPLLRGVSFNLVTRDAHGLYEQFGFIPVPDAEKRMVRPLDWARIREAYGLGRK